MLFNEESKLKILLKVLNINQILYIEIYRVKRSISYIMVLNLTLELTKGISTQNMKPLSQNKIVIFMVQNIGKLCR